MLLLLAMDPGQQAEEFIKPLLFLFLGVVIYFLPAMAAYNRRHRNLGAITATNILLGWTIIGWCVAFIWAYTSNVEHKPSGATPS